MMRMLGCLLAVLACVSLVGNAAKTPAQRLEWMKDQSYSSSGHLIQFDRQNFHDYVIAAPRTYSVLVIFNAISPRFECAACRGIGADSKLIASSIYDHQFGSGSNEPEHPVFVVEVEFDYKDVGHLFGDLGLKSAPLVAFVHPTSKNTQIALDKWVSKLKSNDQFDFNAKGFKAEAVVEFANKKSGLDAHVNRPIDYGEIFRDTVLPLLAIAIPFLVISPVLYKRRHDTRMYFVFALFGYLFAVSGGMFNILKNTPWDERHADGSVSYFHDGNGWQLGSESYICGGLQVLMGLVLISLNTVVVEMKSQKARNVVGALAIGSFIIMFSILRGLVTRKMGSYNHGWVYQW